MLKKCFWGVKCGQCVGLTTLPQYMSRLSRQCGILNISQPYRPPRPVTGKAFCILVITKYFCGLQITDWTKGIISLCMERQKNKIVFLVNMKSYPTPRNHLKAKGKDCKPLQIRLSFLSRGFRLIRGTEIPPWPYVFVLRSVTKLRTFTLSPAQPTSC
jgi:hypothetical protein